MPAHPAVLGGARLQEQLGQDQEEGRNRPSEGRAVEATPADGK